MRGSYGDNQPFEFLLFGGLLRIYDSRETLRIFFALVEASTVVLVGFGFVKRSLSWRLSVMTLLAFSPFLLLAWTAWSEDKPMTIFLLVLILVFIEQGRVALTWAAGIALFVVKWISIFFVVPLAVWTWRERGKGAMLIALSAFLCAAVVAELPYFPESLRAFDRRNARIDLPPGQASPTVLIDRLGLYDDRMVRPLIALCILLIAAAYWKRMIDVQTAVVLSIVSSFLFLPDESADRTALTAVPLLFVIQLDRRRLVTIWLTSVVAALALQTEQWRGMPEPALDFFGTFGSVNHVIFMNLFTALLMVYLGIDLFRRRRLQAEAVPGGSTSAVGLSS